MVRKVLEALKWVRETWRETDKALQALAMILWASGIILAVVGVLGDVRNWWSNKPFLSNIIASLDGALFGIPVALIILQGIINAQEDRRQQREVQRSAKRGASDLLHVALGVLPNPEDIQRVLPLVESIRSCYKTFGECYNRLPDLRAEHFRKGIQQFVELYTPMTSLMLDFATLERRSQVLRYRLDHIEDHVQPRLIDVGLDGIDPIARTDLKRALVPVVERPSKYANDPRSLSQRADQAREYLSEPSSEKRGKYQSEHLKSYLDAVLDCYDYFVRVVTFIECSADICASVNAEESQTREIYQAINSGAIKARNLLHDKMHNYLVA